MNLLELTLREVHFHLLDRHIDSTHPAKVLAVLLDFVPAILGGGEGIAFAWQYFGYDLTDCRAGTANIEEFDGRYYLNCAASRFWRWDRYGNVVYFYIQSTHPAKVLAVLLDFVPAILGGGEGINLVEPNFTNYFAANWAITDIQAGDSDFEGSAAASGGDVSRRWSGVGDRRWCRNRRGGGTCTRRTGAASRTTTTGTTATGRQGTGITTGSNYYGLSRFTLGYGNGNSGLTSGTMGRVATVIIKSLLIAGVNYKILTRRNRYLKRTGIANEFVGNGAGFDREAIYRPVDGYL